VAGFYGGGGGGGQGGDGIGIGGYGGGGSRIGGGVGGGLDGPVTIANTGTIRGGNGGTGFIGAGAGGVGIRGSNMTIVNAGTIAGGFGNGGAGAQAAAIAFTGGSNSLELQAGYVITGKVANANSTTVATNTLILGGTINATFDTSLIAPTGNTTLQYQNFSQFRKTGLSTWGLTNATTAVTPWVIDQGTLSIAQDGSLGAPNGMLTLNGGTLETTASIATNRNIAITASNGTVQTDILAYAVSGVISGQGVLTKTGPGTLMLTGANTYSGGTTISAGTLQLGNGATSGSIVGNVTNNAALAFDRSDTVTFSGIVSGTGALTQIGSGTTILTGVNTYSGGTTISAGTLQLGSGATSGSIVGNVTNNATLAFNRSDTVTFPGIVSGAGALTQIGSGTTILTGANTYSGGTTTSAGTLQLGNGATSGSIVGNVTNNATLAFNRSDTITFPGFISGTGALVQIGTGTTVLTATNTYSGPTTVQRGTLIVNGSIQSATTILPPGTLAGTGTVAGDVTNQGTVWPGKPVVADTSYGVLTIRGRYVDPEGQLVLNTFLGTDGSPSNRLVIDGGTTVGTSTVVVHSTGVSGIPTRSDGIRVVEAVNGATTTVDAFALGAGQLRAGAFYYRLFRGGVGGDAPNDWFLRSQFVVPPIVQPSPTSIAPAAASTVLPSKPPAAVLTPGVYPIVGPELATYGVAQPLARQLGLTSLGTLHERIGDTLLAQDWAGDGRPGWARSGWGRIFGQHIDNRYQTYTDARASGSLAGFQAGLDVWQGSLLPGHRDATGVYFAHGNSSADVDGLVTNAAATGYVLSRTGSVKLDANTGGAYWTHYGPGGWYVDAVLQGTHFDGNATTQFARLPVSGSGFATSLEGGDPIALPFGPGFVLEPQAQLIWQHVGLDAAHDGLGPVDPGSTSGTTGRLGVRGKWTITRENGQVWYPYVRADVWRDWGAQATTTYGGIDQVPLRQQVTRMDLAGGLTAKLDTHMSLYGQFGYQFTLSGSQSGSRQGVWGNVGARYDW